MAHIVVTGCHGFIGHHVCKLLLTQGHRVTGVDRLDGAISPKEHRVRAMRDMGMEYAEVNLADFDATRKIINGKVHAVVHLAAQFAIGHKTEFIKRYVDSNIIGFLNVMEAARLAGVPRVIYASSIESSAAGKPSNLYGASKAFNEHAAHAFSRLGMTTIGLRYGIVYGPMMRTDTGIYRALRTLHVGAAVKINTGFAGRKPMVSIDDAADFTVRLLWARMPNAHSVHLMASEDYLANLVDVIDVGASYMGVSPRFPDDFERPAPREKMADLSSLRAVLGVTPGIRLEDGLPSVVEWIRSER